MGAFIFSIQSKTADFKVWNMFKYIDNLRYGCEVMEDSFEHILIFSQLGDGQFSKSGENRQNHILVNITKMYG